MSVVQDDLFLLVHSLSKVEKSYFIKNSNKGSNKDMPNYMVVFYAIAEMEEYDDQILENLKLKNLSYEKNYLRNAILKSMRAYLNDSSADVQIKGFILDAKFLLNRGIYDQSLKYLKKAKKLAEKYHQTLALLEINQVEQRVMAKTHPTQFEHKISIIVANQQKNIESLQEEIEFSNYRYSIYAKFIQKMWVTKNSEEQELLENFPKLHDEVKFLKSEIGKYHLLNAQKFGAQLLGNSTKVYILCKQIIEWWENHEKIRNNSIYYYAVDLFNLIAACFFLKKYDIIASTYSKIEKLNARNPIENRIIFQNLIQSKQVYFMNLGQFERAKEFINKIEKEVLVRNLNNKVKTTIMGNFAIAFFFLADFWGCIKWINEGLKNKNVKERVGIQKFIRILKCICYWELEQIEAFDLSMRASINFLKGINEPKESFEFQVLDFLRKISTSPLNELNTIYHDFQLFLVEKKHSSKKLKAHGLDEYFYWLESKVKKRSMIELVGEDLKKKK